MPISSRRMFDWLWPELRLFEASRDADWARARAAVRSGFVPTAVLVAAALILCSPLEGYYRWLGHVFGSERIVGELVTYTSILLQGLIPVAVELPFHRRVRRCLRRELVKRGVAVCVDCGCDLRANPVRQCPQCGAIFDEHVVALWLARSAQPQASIAAVHFHLSRIRRWLIPELERFPDQSQAREAWDSGMARVRSLSLVAFLACAVVCLLTQRMWFDALARLLGALALGLLTLSMFLLLILLSYAVILLLFRSRIRRSTRQQLVAAGVPVCIECGYDLRGLTSARCPECGMPREAAALAATTDGLPRT